MNIKSTWLFAAALAFSSASHAVVMSVPATSDLWLAGMPNGSTASFSDSAPGQSPVLVTGLTIAAGGALQFSATGTTDHCTGGSCGLAGAEGDMVEGATGHSTGAENGIGNLVSPIDALIAVFLDDAQPDSTAAPGAVLDFSSSAARDFVSLSPLLKQPFYIGDGLRNDGITLQDFIVPTGATRLFLGTMDGFGWFNNVGELRVSVNAVPEPATFSLGFAALAGLISVRRQKGRAA